MDRHGELFYIQFGSHLVPETKPERMPSSEERQEVLKKKKKSKSACNLCCDGHLVGMNLLNGSY